MDKREIIITVLVLVLTSFFVVVTDQDQIYSIDDFTNDNRIFYDPDLPREELDLRLKELKDREPPREEELPQEAIYDAFRDYLQAGLYGEAWRISRAIEDEYGNLVDAEYLETKGDLLVYMNQYRDAVETYGESLRKDSKRAVVYGKLADLYLYWTEVEDKRKRALLLYEKALALNPSPEYHPQLQKIIESLKGSL